MALIHSPVDLVNKILEVLHIDTKYVTKVVMTIEIDSIVEVEVTSYANVDEGALEDLKEITQAYELTLKDSTMKEHQEHDGPETINVGAGESKGKKKKSTMDKLKIWAEKNSFYLAFGCLFSILLLIVLIFG